MKKVSVCMLLEQPEDLIRRTPNCNLCTSPSKEELKHDGISVPDSIYPLCICRLGDNDLQHKFNSFLSQFLQTKTAELENREKCY